MKTHLFNTIEVVNDKGIPSSLVLCALASRIIAAKKAAFQLLPTGALSVFAWTLDLSRDFVILKILFKGEDRALYALVGQLLDVERSKSWAKGHYGLPRDATNFGKKVSELHNDYLLS